MTYLEWMRHYEDIDPEPSLEVLENDRYEHHDKNGVSLGIGRHYKASLADAHVAWHRRFTDAYMKIKDDLKEGPL